MVYLLISGAIVGGVLLVVMGVACFWYGTRMEEGEQVGFLGTYYDSTAFFIRGTIICLGGLIILTFGLFA